jgi:tRNA threonylcarbamoyladenosine biosynthesis protein TsaB
MRLLAVDTSETSCSLALVEDGLLMAESFLSNRVTHSRVVMERIDHMITGRAGIPLDSIDGFVTARGPGSFTGVRIGISVVKGLAFALSRPAAGVSSLDGIALQLAGSSLPVCAMMDAKRGEVYTALYRFRLGRLEEKGPETVARPGDLLEGMGPACFVGSGARAYRSLIRERLGEGAWFAPGYLDQVRAGTLAQVVFDDPGLLSPRPEDLLPVYLRRSDAEINYERHPDRFC